MKAILVPRLDGRYDIELITESHVERERLIRHWLNNDLDTISCEEFREIAADYRRD